ncbi:MAG: SusC/RagA family TonB-linked outer membrane protein [Mucilaginibacter sp.]
MRKIYLILSVLLLLGSVLKAQAQDRTVTGTVVDEKDGPLPGVTVQVKGSKASTATDANGKYSIKVTNLQNVVIGVSFLGYTYQEKTLRVGEMNADFKMVPSTSNLDEVVVVGYGTQKKATLTGAVETIKVKDIEDIPSLNLASSLVGQVPALGVTQDNRPGQAASITIRNPIQFNGAQGSTQPIYIIDDIKRTAADFNALDPNEIESISILKDAEASIYGVNGGNGAILVRTKKGKNGTPKISFSSSFGSANAIQLPKMMSGIQLATWMNDFTSGGVAYNASTGAATGNTIDANGYINGVVTNKNSAWYTPDELAYISNPANNTNILNNIFHAADVEREALNVSGGSDKVSYFIGADYVNQNSNFSGINSNKWGVRSNLEAKPAKGLTIDLDLNEDQSYSRSFWYKTHGATESLNQDVASSLSSQPWVQHIINGMPVYLNSGSGSQVVDNVYVPLYQNSNNFTQTLNYSTNILGKVSYEIPWVQGLTASYTYNENINNGFPEQYGTNFNYYKFTGTGDNNHIPGGSLVSLTPVSIANGDYVAVDPNYTKSYQMDAMLSYNHSFGKNNITALAIYEQLESNLDGVTTQFPTTIAGGLPNGNYTTGIATANQANSQVAESGEISYIGRVNYDYDGKYLAQVTFRRDGTTSFAPGYQYGNFGSLSLGWVLSSEKFIKDALPFADLLKVRASIGSVGSDQTAAYQYLQQFNPQTGSSGGAIFNEQDRGTGIKAASINNPTVTWDHQTKTDYGLDAAFLRSRLSVTADYYWNHLYDGLGPRTAGTPFTIGNTVPTENYAIANTFGYEVSVGWHDRISSDWSYNVRSFFGWSDNKIIKEDISQGLIGTAQDRTGKSSDGGVFGYESLGLIRTQDQANQIIADRAAAAGGAQKVKILGMTPQPGMINYADLNGDGIISNTDLSDQKYLNKKSNNHYGLGFNFGTTYKSFSINVVTGMSWGGINQVSGADLNGFNGIAHDATENKPVFWSDHWTPQNTNAKYPAPIWYNNYDVTSNYWFVSSFTWDIQNANISYTLPVRWSKVVGLSSARIYAVCTNVLSLTKNPWPDEYKYGSGGIFTYPTLRTISLGLNASF